MRRAGKSCGGRMGRGTPAPCQAKVVTVVDSLPLGMDPAGLGVASRRVVDVDPCRDGTRKDFLVVLVWTHTPPVVPRGDNDKDHAATATMPLVRVWVLQDADEEKEVTSSNDQRSVIAASCSRCRIPTPYFARCDEAATEYSEGNVESSTSYTQLDTLTIQANKQTNLSPLKPPAKDNTTKKVRLILSNGSMFNFQSFHTYHCRV
jgi:hypothetical protein